MGKTVIAVSLMEESAEKANREIEEEIMKEPLHVEVPSEQYFTRQVAETEEPSECSYHHRAKLIVRKND